DCGMFISCRNTGLWQRLDRRGMLESGKTLLDKEFDVAQLVVVDEVDEEDRFEVLDMDDDDSA
ncbi:hypothetical protein BpHYR1_040965, partial [Brachionus plicatilis]